MCVTLCTVFHLYMQSRVVKQQFGERNFHIFYQLLMGASETQLSNLGLRKDPKAYHFVNQGDSNRVIQEYTTCNTCMYMYYTCNTCISLHTCICTHVHVHIPIIHNACTCSHVHIHIQSF